MMTMMTMMSAWTLTIVVVAFVVLAGRRWGIGP
jgi:hypothetical protein